MKIKLIIIITLFFAVTMTSQEKLPYYEIPKMEENYSAQNTVARMIDGLGFRYYWSTESLRSEDLAYQPKGEGRDCQKTINHLYDLSNMMLRLTKTDFKQDKEKDKMTFLEMRKQTLLNLEALSNRIRLSKDLSEFTEKKDGEITIPFFNVINGPIADAIWHTGQVASFRRSSENPISSKVNHFTGTVRE
ncbi:MAG: hypothetical protein V3V28_13105 [Polaribacter sp.]|uniref:hypothetical protein n=1 Tax=Polaribacter sp. TaxID=1920175 RepID=UPI002F35EE6D